MRSDLAEVLGLDVLVALDLETLDGRALVDDHDQRAAIAAHLDVAEEAGVIERPHRLTDALRRRVVADVDRQVVVDRAFGDALQTFDANVADGEDFSRPRLCRYSERVYASSAGRRNRQRGADHGSQTH